MEIEIKPGQRFLISAVANDNTDFDDCLILEVAPSGGYVKIKASMVEEDSGWWSIQGFQDSIIEHLPSESTENVLSTLMKELAPILAPYLLDYLKGQPK